jgi:hypothetical protein
LIFIAAESLKPGIVAHKYLTGYGHERGGVTVNIFNQLNGSQEVDYFDSVPWYLKLYLHTLKVTVLGNDNISQNGKRMSLDAYHFAISILVTHFAFRYRQGHVLPTRY